MVEPNRSPRNFVTHRSTASDHRCHRTRTPIVRHGTWRSIGVEAVATIAMKVLTKGHPSDTIASLSCHPYCVPQGAPKRSGGRRTVKFLHFGCRDASIPARPGEIAGAVDTWLADLGARHVLLEGQPLAPPSTAVTDRVRDGRCSTRPDRSLKPVNISSGSTSSSIRAWRTRSPGPVTTLWHPLVPSKFEPSTSRTSIGVVRQPLTPRTLGERVAPVPIG